MNTKKEIVSFLETIALSVQGKLDHAKQKQAKYKDSDNQALYMEFTEIVNYIEGQLYEINYILGTIMRDRRKKD